MHGHVRPCKHLALQAAWRKTKGSAMPRSCAVAKPPGFAIGQV